MNNYNLKNTDYQLIFPNNLKKYKNLKALSQCIETQLKNNFISKIENIAFFKNLEVQSDEVLSALAYQFSIDNWQESLSHQVKINLIKNAYWAHAKKGTKIAIVENLKKLNYPVTVQEWFEYGGKPFTFKLTLNHINPDPNWIDKLIEIIEKYKNCRSILETTDIDITRKNGIFKFSTFNTKEIQKEFIGIHNDMEKVIPINFKKFRVMEVQKNV